jgi:hypothetical protein
MDVDIMTLSLEGAAKAEANFLPCDGCGTWHMLTAMKKANGNLWCVLCFPAIGLDGGTT